MTWTFPEATSHTTTSDQGFWDSGTRSDGATYSRAFTSAGRFAYHCTFHATHAWVRWPSRVLVTAPSQAKRVIRWSTVKGADGTTFDVQVKRGPGKWTDFRADTTKARTGFKPADRMLAVQGARAHLAERRGLGVVEAGDDRRSPSPIGWPGDRPPLATP